MQRLKAYIESLGISLHGQWEEQITRYYELLIERNKICNLTRITEFEDYLYKHVADSLLIALVYPEVMTEPLRVLDIGCGGGIPGIPLAITFPNLLCSEVDSKCKKAAAVHHFIEELGLENAEAVQAHALELSHTAEYQEQIDLVIARAVGHTSKLLQQGRRFLVPETGIFIAYKTPQQITDERSELLESGKKKSIKLSPEPSEVFELPNNMGGRQFWVLRQSGRIWR